MRATLTYFLPRDQFDYDCATQGKGFVFALDDLDQWLRSLGKNQNQETIRCDEVRNKIRGLLEEHGSSLDIIY